MSDCEKVEMMLSELFFRLAGLRSLGFVFEHEVTRSIIDCGERFYRMNERSPQLFEEIENCYHGVMAERLIASDLKSDDGLLHPGVGSNPSHSVEAD